MNEIELVRVGSHRAGDRLRRLLGVDALEWRCTLVDGGVFAVIPAASLDDARKIPSITKARPNGEVRRCW